MSTVTYNSVLRQAALRVNALSGALAADIRTSYTTVPLTSTQFKSADFPMESFTDGILLAEEKLAHAIANTPSHPWRNTLTLQFTSGVLNEGFLPTAISSNPIIGVWGNARNFETNDPCIEKPLAVVKRRADNPGSFYKVGVNWYNIDSGRVFHTCLTALGAAGTITFDACVYNRSTQQTAINTLTNTMLLPDVLEEAMICGTISYMMRDNAYMEQAVKFREYFEDTLKMIAREGGGKAYPTPHLATV